jgi:hypothetical protein
MDKIAVINWSKSSLKHQTKHPYLKLCMTK